jgi:hypothetical protein
VDLKIWKVLNSQWQLKMVVVVVANQGYLTDRKLLLLVLYSTQPSTVAVRTPLEGTEEI